jgi:acyl-CoA thioester hydrolase
MMPDASEPSPDDPSSSDHRLQVRFAETDLMGVVHHASYLLYCEAARVDWLHKRGISYDSWVGHGIHLAVAEARLRFKRAARFDDILVVRTRVDELSRFTVRFRYHILRGETLIAEAETLLACVGDDLKLKRLPEEVREVFTSPERPREQWAPHLE